MTSNEPPRLQMRSARNIMGSGVVLGIAGGLLLWLMGYVGPVYFLPIVLIAAAVGGILFGVPGYLFERKVNREREEAHEEAEAEAARERRAARAMATSPTQMPAPAGTPVIVLQVGGAGGPYATVPAQTVMNFQGYGAAPTAPVATTAGGRGTTVAPAGAPGGHPSARPSTSAPPTWPLDEPLCVMETNREKDVWAVAQRAHILPEKIIGFTTLPPEEIAQEFGVLLTSVRKVSRVEGDANVDPGDLERIGNIIERHLEGGEGRVVVLPALENLVEAGNVRNVRRLLEVVRDLAQGSKGSMLVSLDPVSLPEANVSLLERGTFKLRESDLS